MSRPLIPSPPVRREAWLGGRSLVTHVPVRAPSPRSTKVVVVEVRGPGEWIVGAPTGGRRLHVYQVAGDDWLVSEVGRGNEGRGVGSRAGACRARGRRLSRVTRGGSVPAALEDCDPALSRDRTETYARADPAASTRPVVALAAAHVVVCALDVSAIGRLRHRLLACLEDQRRLLEQKLALLLGGRVVDDLGERV